MVRNIFYFLLWNASAGLIFWAPHAWALGEVSIGPTGLILLLAVPAYGLLFRWMHERTSANTRIWFFWVFGFHLIFWAEMLMEAVVFTVLDFHNTPLNDPYFMAFWACTVLWLIGGMPWLKFRDQQKRRA